MYTANKIKGEEQIIVVVKLVNPVEYEFRNSETGAF